MRGAVATAVGTLAAMRTILVMALAAATVALASAAPAAADVTPSATLAYVVYPTPVAPGQVWAARADGTARHRLARNAEEPLVSPDGARVVYLTTPSKGDPVLRVVRAAGGAARTLVTGWSGSTAWSPDGTNVVVESGSEVGSRKLVVVDVVTGAKRTVATGSFTGASFSPDGTRLVYARAPRAGQGVSGDLYTVATTGGKPTRVTSDHRSVSPVWGPTAIVFSRITRAPRKGDSPKANLALVQPDGSGRRALTTDHVPYLLYGLTAVAWSADGGALAAEFGGQDFSQGYAVDPVTGKSRALSQENLQLDTFGISRDGVTVLAATGGYGPGTAHDVVTVPWRGGTPTVLVKKAWTPSWSG